MDEIAVELNQETWVIEFVSRRQIPKDRWGDCHYERRRIRVRKDLCDRNMLSTLIHEMLHAQRPHECEEWIDRTAEELAVALLETERVHVR